MADTVRVQIKGLDQLLKGLEVAPELLEAETREAMERSVGLARGLIASRINPGPGRNGHLQSLLTTQVLGPPIRGLVVAQKFTAGWVEFGTTAHDIKEPSGLIIHHPGAKAKHPFRRGFAAARKVIKAYFLAAAVETLRRIAKGG